MITYRLIEECKSKWIGVGFTGNRELLKAGVTEVQIPEFGITMSSSEEDFLKINFKFYNYVFFVSMFSKVEFGKD